MGLIKAWTGTAAHKVVEDGAGLSRALTNLDHAQNYRNLFRSHSSLLQWEYRAHFTRLFLEAELGKDV